MPAAASHNPIFIPNHCTFLHNVYFLLAKIKHALVKVFILKYRKIKTKHRSTVKSPNVSYFPSPESTRKKLTNCTSFWNQILNWSTVTRRQNFCFIIEACQKVSCFCSWLGLGLDVFRLYYKKEKKHKPESNNILLTRCWQIFILFASLHKPHS